METSAIEKIIKLVAKTGLFFASADGVYSTRENKFIADFIGKLSEFGPTDEIDGYLNGLLQKAYTLDDFVAETKDLVAEFNPTEKTVILYMLKNFAQNVIKSDGLSHPNEEKALKDWEEALK